MPMETRDTQNDEALPDRLWTPRDAARLLGVSVRTLLRWEMSGRISARRTAGGHRRFPQSEIDRVGSGRAA